MTPDECYAGCFTGNEDAIAVAVGRDKSLPFAWAVLGAIQNNVKSASLYDASKERLDRFDTVPITGWTVESLSRMYIDYFDKGIKHELDWLYS